MSENYELIKQLSAKDAPALEEKGRAYGASWRKRGGVGAFMVLARKWDRIENICQGAGYDIFMVCQHDVGGILDDIQDLRRYLLLVEAHVTGGLADELLEAKEQESHKWTLRQGADPENPKPGDWIKAEEEDCGPGAGYVNQDGPQNSLSWKGAYCVAPPAVGPFDVIQVRWKDGTHSSMLVHEFGKIAEWSEVEMYRVIRDGANPDELPLPEPVRQWDGASDECMACLGTHPKGTQCPNLTPHAGSHHHTINTGHYLDVQAQPSYSHTTLAGIASAVSGLNAAVSAMPKP